MMPIYCRLCGLPLELGQSTRATPLKETLPFPATISCQ